MAELTGDAWQIRESQRRELLYELMQEAVRAEEESGSSANSFMLGLAHEILTRFMTSGASPHGETLPWDKFLEEVVRPRVREFARSKEEEIALMAGFLEQHVLQDALSPYYHALRRQEVDNPQLIFHAERATDEITIQTDT